MKPSGIHRKEFLKRAGLLVGAVSVPMPFCQAAVGGDGTSAPTTPLGNKRYRVAGVAGRQYNRGFEKLCRYGRFDSFAAAVASVRSPETEFLVLCG